MNHRNRIAGLTTLALLATVPATGWAAGFQNMSQSATANGMAAMGTANPDEPNASFYNAAALAQREASRGRVGRGV